ncbi:MAG: FAD-binding oxidoreductase [Proteobacteria bacterium]|nr:FAD-binding oxidoreductase [Pseudomonadota bacterium]MBU6425156.1 FAD-binding oxidoreductase [Rhodospirillales bacterium]
MEFLQALQAALGETSVLTAPADRAPYEQDWRGLVNNPALAVILPASTQQVSEAVKLCAAHNVRIVPQGGNTGLVAGAVPIAAPNQIILSFSRLRATRALDLVADTVTVEAGMTLAALQQAAAEAGRFFPVSLAAEGTAEIGGVISTNAGGLQVLSYGSMRAQVLGLEVVLADGSIWHGLSELRKDNTGYDLKQLFIGAEGTLGLITAATLRLYPRAASRASALVGIENLTQGLGVFTALRAAAGTALTLCEFCTHAALALGTAHTQGGRLPFEAPAYLLLEVSALEGAGDPREMLEATLMAALEEGRVLDAAIAQSERERLVFLALRENISEGELREGGALKHDIAVPLGRLAEMVQAVEALVAEIYPGLRPNIFGHVGDGNLHVNIRPPAGQTVADIAAVKDSLTADVESLAVSMQGSFSAEHGIGQLRLSGMAAHKSHIELSLMRAVKHALDPEGRFNPGKTIPEA